MKHTYNLKFIGDAASHLSHLLKKGVIARESRRPISGCSDTDVHQILYPHELRIVDDFGVELDGHLLQLNLFKLPSWAYQALLEYAGGINQFCGTDSLIDRLADPMTHDEKREWIDDLCAMIGEGRSHTRYPLSAFNELDRKALFLPGATRLCRAADEQSWTLVLGFETLDLVTWDMGDRVGAVGIDVGRNPLLVAASEDACLHVPGIAHVHISDAELHARLGHGRQVHLAKRLHHLAHTAAARQRLEGALRHLQNASVIYVEDLEFRGMSAADRRALHDLGIQDFLQAWLPQQCCEYGIPLVRIDPAYTSQTCHRCHRRGTRSSDRRRFSCPVHGAMDANENAARVIRQMGISDYLAKQKSQSRRAG